MGHPYKSWWTGSQLVIDEARALVPHQNATTLQVAASVLGAVVWMITHPDEGVRVPDELPWELVLDAARPYLGTQWSGPDRLGPVAEPRQLLRPLRRRPVDREDPWQFTNFLVS